MQLKSLHIVSFGGLRNRDIELSEGVNVIEGANEAGKTSAAMFIKFIFYGLSSKSPKTDGASERVRFVNRDTMQAAGYIMAVSSDGTEYRLERVLNMSDGQTPREKIRIINQTTGETISGENPGEYFFGVPENVFVGTAFVSQNKPVKPDVAGEGTSKGSVENLLTSADENVDIKRAVKKLDAVRKELCHKKGSGGEISDLREKRSALIAERDGNAAKAAEILSATSSVNDIKARIAELEETQIKHSKIYSALEKLEVKHRFDALDSTAGQISDISDSIKMIDDSPIGGSFEEKLLSAERDIRAFDEEENAYNKKLPELPESDDDVVIPDGDAAITKANRSWKKAHGLFIAAAVFLVGGIAALLAALAMYVTNTGKFMIPAGIAAILALTGIALFIIRSGYSSALNDLLGEWDAESADDMESAVYEKIAALEAEQALIDEKRALTDSIERSRLRSIAAEEKLADLARSVNAAVSTDKYALLETLRGLCDSAKNERASLVTKSDKLKGRLEVLSEQLEGIDRTSAMADAAAALADETGITASRMTPDDIKSLDREKEFTDTALRSAIKRKESLDARLAELGKLSRTPDESETLINSLDERIEELTLRRDACSIAQDALVRAGEAMRSGVLPRISANASAMIADCTEKYSRLTVDNAFSCGLAEGDDLKTAEFFSRGTGDLAYIALRLALAEEVFRAERPTLIFDESFAHVDSGRLKNVIRMLSTGEDQHLVFTCRSEEAEAARSLDCAVITL